MKLQITMKFLVFSNLQTPRNKKIKLKKNNEKLEAHFAFVG